MIQTKKAVIYARYSSDNQREESIDAQLRICRKHCADKGYIIMHEYVDEAYTATNDNRPAYQQMLKDSKTGAFDVAVFHKVNRNARNEYDYYANKAKLLHNGVSIEYAGQSFDPDTAEGQLMENQLVGMAAYFSRNLAREVKKGQHENALKCVHNGGVPPLGYDVCPTTRMYVINDSEANVVRYIFRAYANGATYPQIVNECNRRGYRTKRGKSFGYNSLHDMLRNKKYIGIYVYGKIRGSHNKPRNSHGYSSDAVEVPDGLPAIIDRDTWEKVQARLNERVYERGSLHASVPYILSGLIFCGECGRRLTGNRYQKKQKDGSKVMHRYYTCRHCKGINISKDKIEQYVVETVKKHITGKRRIKAIVKAVNDELDKNDTESAAELRSIHKELSAIDKANDNLMSIIEAGELNDIIKQRLLKNSEKAKELRARESALASKHMPRITAEDIQAVLARWNAVDDAESMKAMLHTFVNSVTLYTDRIELDLCIALNGYHYSAGKIEQ